MYKDVFLRVSICLLWFTLDCFVCLFCPSIVCMFLIYLNLYFVILDLYILMRERKGMHLGGWVRGKDLGRLGGGEVLIRICYMKALFQ